MKSASAERRLQIHLNHLMMQPTLSSSSLIIEPNQTNAKQEFLEYNQTRASSTRGVDVDALKAFLDGKYAHVSNLLFF